MQYENVPSISDMVASSSIYSSSFSVKVSWQCEIIAFECKTNTELLFLALGSKKKKNPNSVWTFSGNNVKIPKIWFPLVLCSNKRKEASQFFIKRGKCRAAALCCTRIWVERPNVAMPTSHPPLSCFALEWLYLTWLLNWIYEVLI